MILNLSFEAICATFSCDWLSVLTKASRSLPSFTGFWRHDRCEAASMFVANSTGTNMCVLFSRPAAKVATSMSHLSALGDHFRPIK
jgi:hypothetical protein